MDTRILLLRFGLITVFALGFPVIGTANTIKHQQENNCALANKPSNTLVVVEKITGSDDKGNSHTLYHNESGRRYRLDNIDQVVLDLNAHKIKLVGTFRSLQVVLGSTVYLTGIDDNLQPALRIATEIPERLPLAVDNLKITKDHVIAVYSISCKEVPVKDITRSGRLAKW